MKIKITYLAWLLALFALLAVAGTVYIAWDLGNQAGDRALLRQDADAQVAKSANAVRMHALISDTEVERAALDQALATGAVASADAIEAAGKSAGVDLRVSGTLGQQPILGISANIQTIGFLVEAEGSFAALTRALQTLEMLPLPSAVERVNLEKGSSDSWRLSALVRVFTSSDISTQI